MKADLLQSIMMSSENLPKNQRRVAEYLAVNWESALYESSNTIAAKVGVSQPTVVRTVKSLGYEGFPQFQSQLQLLLQDRISTTKRMEQIANQYEGHDIAGKINKVYNQSIFNLSIIRDNLDARQIKEAADLIWKARKVAVLGFRTSAALAHYLGLPLSMIRKDITIISNDYAIIENMQQLNSQDVLIAFSFTRYYRRTIESTAFAKERGCQIIGITDTLTAPLAKIADLLFLVPTTSLYFSNSYVAVFALLDVLLSIISSENCGEVKDVLADLEESFDKSDTFFKS